jgi:hypothetical protein
VAKTPEGKIQGAVLQWCKKRMIGYIRLAFMPGAPAGWPDTLILLRGGRPLFIEFKQPGKRPTAKQQERIDWLREQGYRVEVFDDADAATQYIQRLREEDAARS